MRKRANLEDVEKKKLVLGIDIALKNHWAVIGDTQGQVRWRKMRLKMSEKKKLTEVISKARASAEKPHSGKDISPME